MQKISEYDCKDSPMQNGEDMLDRTIISDISKPPKYNWWVKIETRKVDYFAPEKHNEIDLEFRPEKDEKTDKEKLGLKLGTFHKTLKKDDDHIEVEQKIRRYLEKQRKTHEMVNKKRKIASMLLKERSPVTNVLIVLLPRLLDFEFVKYGRIIKGSSIIGIFESKSSQSKFRKFLEKRHGKILWEGRTENHSFSDFKILKYKKGIENDPTLFFYKSVVLKIFN